MCGLVTLFSPEGLVSTGVLVSMAHALRHRGPDDLGYAHVDISRSRYRFWPDDLPRGERLAGVLSDTADSAFSSSAVPADSR
jgi:asparagine synthetase B (glutamine-hydrolysing)